MAGVAVGGAAGDVGIPPGAVLLGPYQLSSHATRNGPDWRGDFSFGPGLSTSWRDGLTSFVAHGEQARFELMPVTSGLTRFPERDGVGRDWLCPGEGSSWSLLTEIEDDFLCGSARRCDYRFVLQNGSWLSCPSGSTGTLGFSPAGLGEVSTLTSTVPELDGLELKLLTAPTVFPDPNLPAHPGINDYFGETNDEKIQLHFVSAPVAPPEGELTTEWTMSDIVVLYRRGAFTGTTQLVCASEGTYRVTATEPAEHSIELRGVTMLTCPGEPAERPIVTDFYED